MIYALDSNQCRNYDLSSRREWVLPNGIGGYAMGSAAGSNTRRYHGHLVIADPAPTHRTVLLANLEAHVSVDGTSVGISTQQYQGAIHPEGYQYLERFEVGRFARWQYRVSGAEIEKRLAMHKGENACTVSYRNTGKKSVGLVLRPLVQHKFYHSNFRQSEDYPQVQAYPRHQTVIEHGGIPLVLTHPKANRTPAVGWYFRFEFLRELDRGLDGRDDMYCPCELHYDLAAGEEISLVAGVSGDEEPFNDWEIGTATTSVTAMLQDAASKFLIVTPTRTTIIAGYPWFTDWGRDTMIALPGVCLHTGRVPLARRIIRDYVSQMADGLIPNRFVDAGEEPEYNTVDATLWMANAIHRTLVAEWDAVFAAECHAALVQVIDAHRKGTRYGIKVDASDGLLRQGEEGVQLTWMDAKVGDWVVTPRHGKPVEINGLWINALRVMDWLCEKLGLDRGDYAAEADRATISFEKKFWKATLGYYLDTVDPDDASLRPNQVLAMALPFSPCSPERAQQALGVVARELVTPAGLRTLGPDDAKYKGQFRGDLPTLDAAYHQGTVWPWLMGPYVTALVKFTGDRVEARRLLKAGRELLSEGGLGGIAEVYDGDEPRQTGGCPWQAWSVAEWLRAWVEDAEGK